MARTPLNSNLEHLNPVFWRESQIESVESESSALEVISSPPNSNRERSDSIYWSRSLIECSEFESEALEVFPGALMRFGDARSLAGSSGSNSVDPKSRRVRKTRSGALEEASGPLKSNAVGRE